MKAKGTITVSAAVAALAMAWWNHHRHINCAKKADYEQKCAQEALETFEGEGGLCVDLKDRFHAIRQRGAPSF